MKVLIHQNLLIDNIRYRPSENGTEIPDMTKDGLKIVFHRDGRKAEEGEYMLPKSVRAFSPEVAKEEKKKKLPHGAKVAPEVKSLSAMSKAHSQPDL